LFLLISESGERAIHGKGVRG